MVSLLTLYMYFLLYLVMTLHYMLQLSTARPVWGVGAVLVLAGAGVVLLAAARTRSELFDATMATQRRPR
jgi:hypothetical protein